jgi:hypothetical protein
MIKVIKFELAEVYNNYFSLPLEEVIINAIKFIDNTLWIEIYSTTTLREAIISLFKDPALFSIEPKKLSFRITTEDTIFEGIVYISKNVVSLPSKCLSSLDTSFETVIASNIYVKKDREGNISN